jgi:hypothetical protein
LEKLGDDSLPRLLCSLQGAKPEKSAGIEGGIHAICTLWEHFSEEEEWDSSSLMRAMPLMS